MTIYSLILFLHVLSAFGILVSFGLEWMGLAALQRSCTVEETRESMKKFSVLPWIAGPSFLVALLTGIYLWEAAWTGTAWTVIALVSIVAVAVIGAIMTGPGMAALTREIADTLSAAPAVSQQLQMPVLWASLQVRTWMVVGITFLMTIKPGVVGSLLAMGVTILFGIAMNPATMSYYQRQDVCSVNRRSM